MMKGLKILNDVFSQYSKISKISSLILNYEKLSDYNYYYLDKAIDRKFNDIIKLVEDHRHRLKFAIKEDYEDRVNRVLIKKKIKKFEDWDVFKKEISDDYYSIHNSVVGKITRYRFKYNELIKNSLEEINEQNLNINKNEKIKNIKKYLKEDFEKDLPIMQPTFSSFFLR